MWAPSVSRHKEIVELVNFSLKHTLIDLTRLLLLHVLQEWGRSLNNLSLTEDRYLECYSIPKLSRIGLSP